MAKILNFSSISRFSRSVFQSVMESFRGNFIRWLKTLPRLIANSIIGKLYGCKTFVDVEENLEIAENYSLDHQHQWHKATVSRVVGMDEIRRRTVRFNKVDVTDDLETELAS